MQEWSDARKEVRWKGGRQERKDAGNEAFRTGVIQGRRDRADSRTKYSGKEGYRTENEPV